MGIGEEAADLEEDFSSTSRVLRRRVFSSDNDDRAFGRFSSNSSRLILGEASNSGVVRNELLASSCINVGVVEEGARVDVDDASDEESSLTSGGIEGNELSKPGDEDESRKGGTAHTSTILNDSIDTVLEGRGPP